MGRKRKAEWEYVSIVKTGPKGQNTCKCKYCGHSWDDGPLRIRAHILGLKDLGVDKCASAPQDAKDICRRLHVAGGAQNPLESIDASVSELGDASHGSGNVDVSKVGSVGVSVSSHKKKLSKSQGSLVKAWDLQAQKEATMDVRRFFYAEDVPFWKVRSSYFLDMISAVGKVGQSYKPSSYTSLRTRDLVDEVRCVERELLDIRDKWKRCGCSIVCDGWSDVRRRPIINVMATSIYGSVFLKAVDTSGEVKTGEYIFGLLKDVIMDIGP
ncbi:hypothetical protein L7F22_062905 [Adiantum nelumboides]|nr:hypothetical protein [Adiantum nelumboides]